ncbi:major facilitator superfamily MFS-1 [Grosmannia clavigera kw1407]|uniref:Major facilitator superfamily MFS-1 n=1 Tax=Grosmannia clavigera (strain kw1407 / UAMH 11150) TaxID=655863 RepID=F0XE30_GROCL|nr:major facilitator superfamily MFS-1 [Grosmannia clavigera kw1407]EFX04651.1 major facilitator superfamily MFS-1 [Grosmannia clavigera kw1407]
MVSEIASRTWDDPQWPPGTVRLELIKADHSTEIVLQPRPTSDPNDPLNWPMWRKYLNFGLAAFFALMVAAQVSATTPTWGPMGDELHFSDAVLNDTYAIGCATLALGGFMLIPFALKYGLRPIYVLTCLAQLGVMIWAARTETAGDWWGVNAVQCWLGSLGECMVQMTITDIFFVHQRGLMNSIYVWAYSFGGNLAPVAAGYITYSQGWRWVWWWCAIFFAVETVIMVLGFEESKFDWTAVPISGRPLDVEQIVDDKTDEKGRPSIGVRIPDLETDSPDAVPSESDAFANGTTVEINQSIPRKPYWKRLVFTTTTKGPWQLFARHAYQPFMIMFTIPGIGYICLVYAVLLSWGTVMSAAQSTYMIEPPYNFDSTQIGLMNLPPFIGNTIGTLISGPLSDWIVLKLAKRNGGIYEPEMRLWIILPFIPLQIAGPFWFGYALQDGQSWVSVAFATGLTNFAQAPITSVLLTYMLDAYNEIIGDSLVALTFSRNTFSTVYVFAMTPWIAAVGMSNVFNTIGAIGVVVLLFAGVFIWKGKHWRYRTLVTMPKNTYIFAPNHSTTPGGVICLGHVLGDISKFVPINRNDVVPIENPNSIGRKRGFTMRRARMASSKLGIFGQIFSQLGVGVDVGISASRKRTDILSVNCLDTESFDPTDAYISDTIKLPEIALFLSDTHYKYPLYLITGLKIARDGGTRRTAKYKKIDAAGSPVGSPPMLPAPVGESLGDASGSVGSAYASSTDFILALRVLKIAFRHGQLRHAPYIKKEKTTIFNSDDSASGDGKGGEAANFMVTDVSIEDVDDGEVQIKEVDYGDDDVWLIPVAQYCVENHVGAIFREEPLLMATVVGGGCEEDHTGVSVAGDSNASHSVAAA